MYQDLKHRQWTGLQSFADPNNYLGALDAHKINGCGITLDFSNQRLSTHALQELIALANTCDLKNKIAALMRGEKLNQTEQRPALHTALRAPHHQAIWVDEMNIMDAIVQAQAKMERIVTQIRNKAWRGYSGKLIDTLVNIGIGGSDLGPKFCISALDAYISPEFKYHFISDANPRSFEKTVAKLNPETTLFIIASKSFTTKETLYNANKAKAWIGDHPNHQQHFIAITSNIEQAIQYGMDTILPIWDWVGGRFSFCSAINLISAIGIGMPAFQAMLSGAHAMDTHFATQEFSQNLPIVLALLGIWNNNFLDIRSLLILTYGHELELLVPYIQQLDMESNGKSVDIDNRPVAYATSPLVWGGVGNQAQHSYYQLLCQGTHPIAAEFISLKSHANELIDHIHHSISHVLIHGNHAVDIPYQFIQGKIPINQIRLDECTPQHLGALIALYEHKIFTQSVIWNINPFDQPGVETAKQIPYRGTQAIHEDNIVFKKP